MDTLLLIEYAGWLAVLLALITAPRWCGRSITRHRMWQLRDRIAVDVLEERLPSNREVRRLIAEVEKSIAVSDQLTMMRVQLFRVFTRHLTAEDRKRVVARHAPQLADLDTECAVRVKGYYSELRRAEALHVMFGSWSGLAILALAGFVAMAQVLGAIVRDQRPNRSEVRQPAVIDLRQPSPSHARHQPRRVKHTTGYAQFSRKKHPVRYATMKLVDRELVEASVPEFVGSASGGDLAMHPG